MKLLAELNKEEFKVQIQKGPSRLYKIIQKQGYGKTLGDMHDLDPATWEKWWMQLQKKAQTDNMSPADQKTMEGLNIYMQAVLKGEFEDYEFVAQNPKFDANEYFADKERKLGIRGVVQESLFGENGEFRLRENSADYLKRIL